MLNLSDWENNNFSDTSFTPDLTVNFPSREIFFSKDLMARMHMSTQTSPKTLDQWYELCLPSDHIKISQLERFIHSHENFISITRRLYCGDGIYRPFRLDAFIIRSSKNNPVKLFGIERASLTVWLENSHDGDKISINDKIFEAVSINGIMTLRNLSEIEDMHNENIILRREIQKRIFSRNQSIIKEYKLNENNIFLRNSLEENINLALNVLTSSNHLKALRRSLNESSLTIGICGLTGSGKSSFINALLGEKLIPESSRLNLNIPILCREGETRSSKIFYQDGRIEKINSTKLIFDNSKNISRIEIIIPGALIPEGICIIDTPGYDSLTGSNSALLKNIIPEFDLIVYVTPIRSQLKGADYEYLRMITGLNDKIIFVLSQIDLESEDNEAGKIINSVEAKISDLISHIQRSMRKLYDRNFDVIPVSAKNALDKFYDRNSNLWRSSNIESFVKYLDSPKIDTFTQALILRAERTLRLLDKSINHKILSGSSLWRLQEYAQNLRKIINLHGSTKIFQTEYKYDPQIHSQIHDKNLLSSLITSLREHDFKNRFFALKSFNHDRHVIILGADRSQSLKLFARLAHNLSYEKLPEGDVTSKEWLFSGNDVIFQCVRMPVIRENENFLIAPSDYEIAHNIDWHNLFLRFTPAVCVDLARIDSGLSDLSHSPYITWLAVHDWILVFGNAGLFSSRQKELVVDVPERIKEFCEASGIKSPEYFIYENYRIF